MSEPIITVENLGKSYRLRHQGETRRHDALRDVIAEKARRLFSRGRESNVRGPTADRRPPTAGPVAGSEEFWALRDVSFEVNRGEVVGIIGRNGAGKSTLLKVLSRITEPTTGRVHLRGRVASLLEVGTGFHPELSGRENVFLNGAILGMSRAEIKRKFAEIAEFAGVEKFLDTPVKRYSSGMYVRLAFAVAAHLEPEILIVDEVLAVGDAQFQKKCLGKMQDVAGHGRTILFVSHNMAAVKTLCSRAMLLAEGGLKCSGGVGAVISEYLQAGCDTASEREWPERDKAPGNEHIRLECVRVRPPAGEPEITIDTGAEIEIGFFNAQAGINLDCTVHLLNSDGLLLCETGRIVSSNRDSRRGSYRVFGRLPPHLLNAGRYYLTVFFGKDQYYVLFRQEEAVAFAVGNTATGRGHNMNVAPGVIRPLLEWRQEFGASQPAQANE
jgi:lipopolysaccharide transport system ATP-binding protein